MTIERIPFGKTDTGEAVDIFVIGNRNGCSLSLITYGGTITSFRMPDKNGTPEEITLGYDTLAAYEGPHPYLGATVGRFANRIGRGTFTLDGITYSLPLNDKGLHHLHGGPTGFSRRIWEAFPVKRAHEAGVKLSLSSGNGDQGYPGNLDVLTTIMLTEENEIRISWEASCDAPTPVSLTNHTYWNLAGAGKGSILDQIIKIYSPSIVEVDSRLIPTGQLKAVEGTPFDFRIPKTIGKEIDEAGGYDHCFTLSPENGLSLPAAEVWEESSGRKMTVYSTSPGIQFYTGNFLDNLSTRDGIIGRHGAFCLETGEYPDAVNHPEFPDAVLRPGQRYIRETVYHFSVIRAI